VQLDRTQIYITSYYSY